ncbi:MAG: M28 family peptidase, partial [Phycisphaerales bacterium]|nr:M28 family peptidase [Phycisphaerales bacterium]
MPRSAPCRLTASIAAGFLLDALLLTGCAATAPTPGGISVIEGQETATPAIPMGDRATIRRVLDIARHDSRVMDDLTYICTTFGPRLTGSTAAEDAGRWALDQFESWGLSNAHMQPWGELGVRFDRLESTGEIVSKKRGRGSDDEDEWETDRELEFTTLAWTRGTDGPVVGRVVRMPESIDAVDPEALSGAWVLVPAAYGGRRGVRSIGFEMRERLDLRHSIRTGAYDPFADPEPEEWNGTINYGGEELPLKFLPQRDDAGVITGGRLTISGPYDGPIENVAQEDKTLTFDWPTPHMTSKIELAIDDKKLTGKADGEYAISLEETVPQDQHAMTRASDQILARVLEAEPAGFLSASLDERVWTTRPNNWRDITVADVPRDIEINVRRSDYDAINSRLADGQEVDARFNLHHVLTEGPIAVYNTIAEIRGVTKPDEVVIVSAHLDSWNGPGSQGTTDNGTGSSVVL